MLDRATLRSTGHFVAAQIWASFHSGPNLVRRKVPLTSNVERPLFNRATSVLGTEGEFRILRNRRSTIQLQRFGPKAGQADMQTNYRITLGRSCLAMPALANRFQIRHFAIAKCCQSVDDADHCVTEIAFWMYFLYKNLLNQEVRPHSHSIVAGGLPEMS